MHIVNGLHPIEGILIKTNMSILLYKTKIQYKRLEPFEKLTKNETKTFLPAAAEANTRLNYQVQKRKSVTSDFSIIIPSWPGKFRIIESVLPGDNKPLPLSPPPLHPPPRPVQTWQVVSRALPRFKTSVRMSSLHSREPRATSRG